MAHDPETADQCALCGEQLPDRAVDRVGDTFCSDGCRHVARELPLPDGSASVDVEETPPVDARSSSDDDLERTFFRIDGMYAATCEAFLEAVAESRDGVVEATASYVTEAVRVDHDPDRCSAADLEDALTTTGYTAYRRDQADTGDEDAGGTRRAREMSGLRKRRSEDTLEIRYIVGVVFGTFLLVPYVTVFYPVHLAAFSDWGMLGLYGETFADFDGFLFLPLSFVVTGVVLYLAGMPLLRGAYISLRLRRVNTHVLAAWTIVSAYVYGTLALALGRTDVYYDLTIVVAALVVGAIFHESTCKRRASERLTDLTASQVAEARVYEADGSTRTVPVDDLEAGDRILVRAGERIPVDGVLREDGCTVDEAVVTGESLPVPKAPGDPVIGGAVVTGDAAVVEVGADATSTIARLTERVWDLQSVDHGVGRRADALATRIAPAVVGAILVVGIAQYATGSAWTTVTMATLLTVVVASPWALAFAPQLSVAESIREAGERGIVVFDETVFERLRAVDTVVFDKTGTLTAGAMTIHEATVPDDLLEAAGALERRGSHPAATAIAAAVDGDGTAVGDTNDRATTDGGTDEEPPADERADTEATTEEVATGETTEDGGTGATAGTETAPTVEAFHSHATGVSGVVDGGEILVGHPDLFRERGWELEDRLEQRVDHVRERGQLPVVVGRDGTAAGVVVLGDEPRPNWEATVSSLEDDGVSVVVLTGDEASAAAFCEAHSGVDHVFAGVSPAGKTAAIGRLRASGTVAMVGDGTNDAPALADADLGISLGGGTALAADAADLAIVDDDLAAVEDAFTLARAARDRTRQSLGLALGYNVVLVPVALAGLLNPLFVAVAAGLTATLVGLNATRPLLDS
ncbi:cation-translocating P-type ATPase [Salinadaptatus halalkaliphilus]|uniref:Cation-translocating P-type ATPase n=1 Tax=Salinadaptatus halalkaliphilus TaxID=2419781 RepID=A0A4S3TTF3_9EURY|nr:cation-translocating P-type ATPase [Salinadaptatus halalkaliphilus]THE66693.1 cation-translocating P-type ATPase [Salinadaptatus halalkaliphilus]